MLSKRSCRTVLEAHKLAIGVHARLCAPAVGIALAGFLCVASAALAVVHHPTRDFARFADCPLSNPAVELCIYAKITGGELIIGHKRVAIDRPITLQGGGIDEGEGVVAFVGAEDGNTLSKTVLSIPGGLSGLSGVTRTTAATVTIELAEPASAIALNTRNLIGQEGVALGLHVRARINNPLLGEKCYVGSAADPLVLNLTTGTTSPPPPNKPIAAKPLEFIFLEEVIASIKTSLVDDAFAVPAATGCDRYYAPLVDADIGIPSRAGRNTAIMVGELEIVYAQWVKESE